MVILDPAGDDSALLALELKFNAITAELLTVQRADDMGAACSNTRAYDDTADTKQVEAVLETLCPIERAIMHSPANTMAGLGVKARHAAQVLSHYWDGPIDRLDWDAQAIRLLIEAVCEFAKTPLVFRNLEGGE